MKQHLPHGTFRLLFLSLKVILDRSLILQHPHSFPFSSPFLPFPSSQGNTGVCVALGKPGSLSKCFHDSRKLWLEGKGCGSLAASVTVSSGHRSHFCCAVSSPCPSPEAPGGTLSVLPYLRAFLISTNKRSQVAFFHVNTLKWLYKGAENIQASAGDGGNRVGLKERGRGWHCTAEAAVPLAEAAVGLQLWSHFSERSPWKLKAWGRKLLMSIFPSSLSHMPKYNSFNGKR